MCGRNKRAVPIGFWGPGFFAVAHALRQHQPLYSRVPRRRMLAEIRLPNLMI